MAIFDFNLPGVIENLNRVITILADSQVLEAEMHVTLTPLEDGGWVGQGAQAFFEEMQEWFAAHDRLQSDLNYFQSTLILAMDTVAETMQAIDNITRSQ